MLHKEWNGFRTFSERKLEEALGKDKAREWWAKPNKHLGGSTPDDMWDRNPQKVVTMLLESKV